MFSLLVPLPYIPNHGEGDDGPRQAIIGVPEKSVSVAAVVESAPERFHVVGTPQWSDPGIPLWLLNPTWERVL